LELYQKTPKHLKIPVSDSVSGKTSQKNHSLD